MISLHSSPFIVVAQVVFIFGDDCSLLLYSVLQVFFVACIIQSDFLTAYNINTVLAELDGDSLGNVAISIEFESVHAVGLSFGGVSGQAVLCLVNLFRCG